MKNKKGKTAKDLAKNPRIVFLLEKYEKMVWVAVGNPNEKEGTPKASPASPRK